MSFTIYLINHSHIDVGYTERQEKIAAYQADFIRQAVDLAIADEGRNDGNGQRFKFTAEGFWAVEQYLGRYGEKGRQRLVEAVKSGGVELTAGYLHFTELLNYENLCRSLMFSRNFCLEHGLKPPEAAMSADVNGFSYGFADALCEAGVQYLITCINTHHGGVPFGKPMVPFYWRTKKGKRILVYSGLTYHKANLLGLIPGLMPLGDPGIPGMLPENNGFKNIEDASYAEKRISDLVKAVKDAGYRLDFMPVMGSGLYTDNSPISDGHVRIVNDFNQRMKGRIEIKCATLKEFFQRLKAENGIDEYSGDWNDFWTDGVASAPMETKLFRSAQRSLAAAEKLDPERKFISCEDKVQALRELLLYAEHTFGHSSSLTDSERTLVSQLDMRKSAYAARADEASCKVLDGVLRDVGEGEFAAHRPFEYIAVNPLNQPVSGTAKLFSDFWEEGLFQKGVRVSDEAGKAYPSQRTYTLRGSSLEVPVKLEPNERRVLKLDFTDDKTEFSPAPPSGTLDTGVYKVRYGKSGIERIETAEGHEVFELNGYALGEPLRQIFPKGNRQDAAGFGYGKRKKPLGKIERAALKSFSVKTSGAVFTDFTAEYELSGTAGAAVDYRFYTGLSRIEIVVRLKKQLTLDPEGMYACFDFSSGFEKAHWKLDKAGAFIGLDERLPCACADYYPVQRGAALIGKSKSLVLGCTDAPLLTFGHIKLWDFSQTPEDSPIAFGWLTNNKWETNFRASSSGCMEFRYYIDLCGQGEEQNCLERGEFPVITLRK